MYGESFRAVQWIKTDGIEALGYYAGHLDADYQLAPNLLDAVLQVCIALNQDNRLFLPFALEGLNLQRPLPAEGYVHVRGGNNNLEFQVLNTRGEICVELKGLSTRPVGDLNGRDWLLPISLGK